MFANDSIGEGFRGCGKSRFYCHPKRGEGSAFRCPQQKSGFLGQSRPSEWQL